jgi:hypothetical protein
MSFRLEDRQENPKAFSISEIKTVSQDVVWDAANKDRLLERWIKEIGSKR